MQTRYRRLGFFAPVAVVVLAVIAGCGGGGKDTSTPTTSSFNGVLNPSATASGTTVSFSMQTDRSNIATAWAIVSWPGNQQKVTLVATGDSTFAGSLTVAAPGATVSIQMWAQDSQGNILGPAAKQVTMLNYNGQPTVTGTVLTTDNQPISGAMVVLSNQTASTNNSGVFSFVGLTPGLTLQGTISKSGFDDAHFVVTTNDTVANVGTIHMSATSDQPPAPPVF